jgi:isopenicillin N synthase-like dioxygenase
MAVAAQRRVAVGEVPVIDIAPLGGDRAAEAAVVAEMRRACEATGFFYIANHGIAPATVAEMFRQSRRFFALPLAARQAVSLTKSPLYRGYLPIGARGENRERKPDLLESFNIGRELGPDDPAVRAGTPLHGPNQWPDGLPGFRAVLLDYYAQLDALALRLLGGFALALGLPRDGLDARHRQPLNSIRLLHYPPEPDPGFELLGARPHRDTGIFTILLQDENLGLEVADPAGDWMVVPPIPGTFVVNIAEMMAVLTNGRFATALHRVINCYGRDRYSIPYFVTPDYDAVIETLPQFIDHDHPPGFASCQAGLELHKLYRGLWPSAGQPDAAA